MQAAKSYQRRRAYDQNARTLPMSGGLAHSAHSSVAHEPAGVIQVPASRALPITWLNRYADAMGIVAGVAPLEIVVPALFAEPIPSSKLLQ